MTVAEAKSTKTSNYKCMKSEKLMSQQKLNMETFKSISQALFVSFQTVLTTNQC